MSAKIISFRERKTDIEMSSWEIILRAEIGFDGAVTVKSILPPLNNPVILVALFENQIVV